jgi:hypothetical protein
MKHRWFTAWGWIYLPVSVEGAIVTLLALAFCAQVFWAIDRNSHSVTDTLYGIYPFWGVTILGLLWIASKTSGEKTAA